MRFFSRTPSTTDVLLQMMQEQLASQARLQEAQIAAMRGMVEAAQRQTAVVQEYLQWFMKAPAPEVRIMTDVDELLLEQKREAKRKAPPEAAFNPADFDPKQWVPDMSEFFAKMKQEL